jgi:hypothetical protein
MPYLRANTNCCTAMETTWIRVFYFITAKWETPSAARNFMTGHPVCSSIALKVKIKNDFDLQFYFCDKIFYTFRNFH